MKPTVKHFDLIEGPIITEKSTDASNSNTVVFRVRRDATKPAIKAAIEAIFGFEVVKVNTLVLKGKVKRVGGITGRRKTIKKAYVRLAEGSSINISGRA